MNMLQVRKYYFLIKEKYFEKQTEKQIGTLKSVEISNEKDELKQTDGVYPEILINALLNCKILLKKMIYILNKKLEKLTISVNIHYLFFKRCK